MTLSAAAHDTARLLLAALLALAVWGVRRRRRRRDYALWQAWNTLCAHERRAA